MDMGEGTGAPQNQAQGALAAPGFADLHPELFAKPRLGMTDLAVQMWRGKVWMIGAAFPLFAAGALWAARLPPEYTASGQLHGVSSPTFVRAVASELEGPAFLAFLSQQMSSGLTSEGLAQSFAAAPSPDGGAVMLAGQGADEARVSRLLPEIVDAYARYREALKPSRTAEGEVPSDAAAERRRAEQAVADADAAMTAFMIEQSVVDLPSETERIPVLIADIDAALVDNRAAAAAVAQQIRAAEQESENLAQSPDAPQDAADTSPVRQRIAVLARERVDLLSRYTPQSAPVQALDRQIAALEALADDGEGTVPGNSQEPSSAEQASRARLAALRAEARAMAASRQVLQAQRDRLAARGAALAALLPDWRHLERDRAAADKALLELGSADGGRMDAAARTPETPMTLALGRVTTVDITATKRKQIIASSALLSLLAALLAGFVYARTQRTFASAGSVLRTLGVPVLATIPDRPVD